MNLLAILCSICLLIPTIYYGFLIYFLNKRTKLFQGSVPALFMRIVFNCLILITAITIILHLGVIIYMNVSSGPNPISAFFILGVASSNYSFWILGMFFAFLRMINTLDGDETTHRMNLCACIMWIPYSIPIYLSFLLYNKQLEML
jgi:hypothetical protein